MNRMRYIKHLSLYISAILFYFLFSCVEKKETTFVGMDIPDSTMIDTAHYEVRKIKVGSHITNRPLSSKIEDDETQEIKYYISQNTYSYIIFDRYRNVYIRIAEHPLNNWSVEKNFVKPKSFIISDTNGKILSETPIIANSTHMQMFNMHVCKNGLAIAMDNSDENNIYFACLRIK